jgi:hypothetical protein
VQEGTEMLKGKLNYWGRNESVGEMKGIRGGIKGLGKEWKCLEEL